VKAGKLTTGQAAELIGVSKQTLVRWDALSVLIPVTRLPSLGRNGGRRYSVEQIEEFIRSCMGRK
jgi:DNA-binding transcriptional MerR regulator